MLPTNTSSKKSHAYKVGYLFRKIAKRNNFFRFYTNVTAFERKEQNHDEVVWYPINLKSYGAYCKTFGLSLDSPTRKKHLLFFTSNVEDSMFIFKDCEIRFDDKIIVYYKKTNSNSIIFEELYKIDSRKKTLYRNILSEINISKEQKQLNISLQYIWNRRTDLHGTNFKAISEKDPPWIIHIQDTTTDSDGNKVFHYEGFIIDILDHLKSKLNFTITTYVPKKRHNWSYLVEQVGKGKLDFGATGFTFTPSRSKIVDFSFGILSVSYTLAYVPNSEVLMFTLFLKPFETDAWVAVFFYTIIVVVACFLLRLLSKKRWVTSDSINVLQDSINFAMRSVVGKRTDFEMNWNFAKIAFAFIVINGFLLITCYRALLVASMTAKIELPPVTSLKELGDSKYSLVLQKGSATEAVFLEAEPGSEEYNLIQNKKVIHIDGSQIVILENMANNAKMASEMILFSEKPFLQFHDYFPCRILDIKEVERKSQGSLGMIYRRNWPFKDLFNYHLLAMKESGLMDKLLEPYLRATRKVCPNQQVIKSVINKPNPVNMYASFSLYIIVIMGLITSFVCFTIEIICHRCLL